jgi:hypothetical protein
MFGCPTGLAANGSQAGKFNEAAATSFRLITWSPTPKWAPLYEVINSPALESLLACPDLRIARVQVEMATSQRLHLLLLVLLVFCLSGNGVYAFGAGNIPRCAIGSGSSVWGPTDNARSYGVLKGKAFRHGDIVCLSVCALDGGIEHHYRKRSWETCSNATV